MVNALASWCSVSLAFESLYLDSQEYEEFAIREMENVESALNRRGRELVSELQEIRRCYLWLTLSEDASGKLLVMTCPICEQAMAQYATCFFPVSICLVDMVAMSPLETNSS